MGNATKKTATSVFDDTVDIEGITKSDPLRYAGSAKQFGGDPSFHAFSVVEDTTVKETFPLLWNPQSIKMSEPAATTIMALQNAGKYIERRGNIFKEILIAGTTGYMPNIRAASYPEFDDRFRLKGNDAAAKKMTKASGFYEFHNLRNFFRRYQNLMRTGKRDQVNKTRMVWSNFKDDEFFVVEPLDFTTTRDRQKPLTYDYAIQFRFIEVIDAALFKADLIRPKLGGLAGFIQAALEAIETISNVISKISGIINAVVDAVKSAINTVLGILDSISHALQNFVGAITSVINLPVSVVKRAAASMKELLNVANDFATLPTDVTGAIIDGIQTCNNLAAEIRLFKPTFEDAWNKKMAEFQRATASLRGEPEDIDSPTAYKGISEEKILPGETIQMLAARLLGDATRFIELIVLNNLSAPYITPNRHERAPGTLCYGDDIRVPDDIGSDRNSNTTTIKDNQSESAPTVTSQAAEGSTPTILIADPSKLVADWRDDQWVGFVCEFITGSGAGQIALIESNTSNLLYFQSPVAIPPDSTTVYAIHLASQTTKPSGAEQSLGIDIALTETYDLAKTATGDLRTVAGFANMQQAIDIKLRTEQGTLTAHNFFGIAPATGTKATGSSLSQHRINARRTLLSDARVGRIKQLGFTAKKDVVEVNGEVELKFSGITRNVSGTI